VFANGDLIAFSMDGEKVWGLSLGMPDNHYGHSSSLITYKNLLIVQYDHNESTHLMALDVMNGKKVWDVDRNTTISWSSPIIVYNEARDEVIVESSTSVYSYAPDTGELYWKQECLSGEVAPSPAYADGVTYVANDNASAVAIDSRGQVIWSVDDVDLPDVSSPLIVGDKLLLFSSFGVITCMERESGKVAWTHENNDGTGFYSSPILVGDRVYAVDMSGIMHIFTVEPEFKEVATPSLGEFIVATPAFVGGKIYIRSNKWLYCIGS
jgi:outer membrane protein assembly factor BamB